MKALEVDRDVYWKIAYKSGPDTTWVRHQGEGQMTMDIHYRQTFAVNTAHDDDYDDRLK